MSSKDATKDNSFGGGKGDTMLRVSETAVIKLQLITSICRGRASPNSSCRDKIMHLNAEKINRDEGSLYLDL